MKARNFMFINLTLCVVLLAAGCAYEESEKSEASADVRGLPLDDDSAAASDDAEGMPPEMTDPVTVVPSAGLPAEVELQNANNNLDTTRHDGIVFLAFRTAPTHFASADARIDVVSSSDQRTWSFEASWSVGADMREPRLLSWKGRLFLYFAVLGTNPLDFEPGGMMVSERLGPGQWTDPKYFYGEGFIPWRTKTIDGVPYMLTYIGGESIYDFTGTDIKVHWLTTGDGYNWIPAVPGQPVVLEGGCSETDFVFQDDGSLVAVCRNEGGDEMGWGSKICRAEARDLGDWKCRADPKKYDSPLLFRHGDEIYLIGRRNVSPTGNFDLGMDDLPQETQALLYSAVYWFLPKRCSLWRVDPVELKTAFVLDLPSRGDTCFPGLLDEDDGEYEVYNYTSPLDGPDAYWLQGQLGATSIYRLTLSFPNSEAE